MENISITEYERLWKSNDLEKLKLTNPNKFDTLRAEYLASLRANKKPKASPAHSKSNLSIFEIVDGSKEYDHLFKTGGLLSLKKIKPSTIHLPQSLLHSGYQTTSAIPAFIQGVAQLNC